jgi:predicted GIY-YIG superfamily endonuclease
MEHSQPVSRTRQEPRRRQIYGLANNEQYCYVSHSVDAASKARELMRKNSCWTEFAIVEEIEGSFSEAAECARKWRVIASMNFYEEINNPRVLQYAEHTPLFVAAEKQAHLWPFQVHTIVPPRKISTRDERFLKRDRHIYVIADEYLRCYVGQSVNPKSRVSAHFSGHGTPETAAWLQEIDRAARYVVVESVHGNYWDAVRIEYKWRCIAELNGYQNVDICGALMVCEEIEQKARESQGLWPFCHGK